MFNVSLTFASILAKKFENDANFVFLLLVTILLVSTYLAVLLSKLL